MIKFRLKFGEREPYAWKRRFFTFPTKQTNEQMNKQQSNEYGV